MKQLKADGFASAGLYDPPGVGGTGVVTVLKHGDHPEWYGLPRRSARAGRLSASGSRCCGRSAPLAILGAVVGAVGHFMSYGPKEVRGADDEDANLPGA